MRSFLNIYLLLLVCFFHASLCIAQIEVANDCEFSDGNPCITNVMIRDYPSLEGNPGIYENRTKIVDDDVTFYIFDKLIIGPDGSYKATRNRTIIKHGKPKRTSPDDTQHMPSKKDLLNSGATVLGVIENVDQLKQANNAEHDRLREKHESSLHRAKQYRDWLEQQDSNIRSQTNQNSGRNRAVSGEKLGEIFGSKSVTENPSINYDCSSRQSVGAINRNKNLVLQNLVEPNLGVILELKRNNPGGDLHPVCKNFFERSFTSDGIVKLQSIDSNSTSGPAELINFESVRGSPEGLLIREVANKYQEYWYSTNGLRLESETSKNFFYAGFVSLTEADRQAARGDANGAETLAEVSEALLDFSKGVKDGVLQAAEDALLQYPQLAKSLYDLANAIDDNPELVNEIAEEVIANLPSIKEQFIKDIYNKFDKLINGSSYDRGVLLGEILTETAIDMAAGPVNRGVKLGMHATKKALSKKLHSLKSKRGKGKRLKLSYDRAKDIRQRIDGSDLAQLENDTAFEVANNSIKLKMDSVEEIDAYGKLYPALRDLPLNNHPKRIRPGSNEKIAIIGRKMGIEKNEPGVMRLKEKLDDYADVEVFKPSKPASEEWIKLTKNRKKYLTEVEVKETLTFKENVKWIEKMRDEGYSILDIEYPENIQEIGTSVFYDMERSVVWGMMPKK